MPHDQSKVLPPDHKTPGSPLLLLIPIPRAVSRATGREAQLLTQVDVSKGPAADLSAQAVLIPHAQLHASPLVQKQKQVRDGASGTPTGGWHSPSHCLGSNLASLRSRAVRCQPGVREPSCPHTWARLRPV